MSPITVSALIVIFGIAASSGDTATYNCYSCTSSSSSVGGSDLNNCEHPNSNTPTCSGSVCIKTATSASVLGVSASSTTRTCSPSTTQTSGCQSANAGSLGSGTTCYCAGNLCNSATRGTVSGIAMTAAAGLVLAMTVAARLM